MVATIQGPISNLAGASTTVDEIPPRIEDVTKYFQEHNYAINADDWMDFYRAKNWTVDRHGKVRMKDWRAAARRWIRNGWGLKPTLSEWERKQKQERLREMKMRLEEITHPGGSAYPVELKEDQAQQVETIRQQMAQIRNELNER